MATNLEIDDEFLDEALVAGRIRIGERANGAWFRREVSDESMRSNAGVSSGRTMSGRTSGSPASPDPAPQDRSNSDPP